MKLNCNIILMYIYLFIVLKEMWKHHIETQRKRLLTSEVARFEAFP